MSDIPAGGADIEVRYEYKGNMIWWPGVIESTVRNSPRSNYLGRGTIVYDAKDDHPREHECLRFLPGRKVLLSGKDGKVTTWRFTSPSDNDGADDEDFEGPARRPSKKFRSEQSSNGSTKQLPADENDTPNDTEMRDIAIDSIATRMTKVERMLQVKTSCNHASVINQFVNVRRTMFRREISVRLAQTQRTWRRTGTPFQEAIRADIEEISVKDDLKLFQYIVDDARVRSHDSGLNRVDVRPHWVDVKRTIRCASADVIFSTLTALMEWLDVTSEGKTSELCTKEWKEKGVTHMRVVGSLRWSENDITQPVQFFPGRSAGPADATATSKEDAKSQVLQWGTGSWDIENNAMVSRPTEGHASVGSLRSASARSIIALSWSADTMSCSRSNGSVVDPTDVVLGTLSLKLPVVFFRGNQLCADVKNLLKQLE